MLLAVTVLRLEERSRHATLGDEMAVIRDKNIPIYKYILPRPSVVSPICNFLRDAPRHVTCLPDSSILSFFFPHQSSDRSIE